jgi:hypothetical protein
VQHLSHSRTRKIELIFGVKYRKLQGKRSLTVHRELQIARQQRGNVKEVKAINNGINTKSELENYAKICRNYEGLDEKIYTKNNLEGT